MEFVRDRFGVDNQRYSVSKLIGDASDRQYFRLVEETGDSHILAAYPKPFDARRFPYQQVYDLLRRISLPVPRIDRLDGRLAIVLQQDLGNETLHRRLVSANRRQRQRYFKEAVRHIVTLQTWGTKELLPEYDASKLAFDREKLEWELGFFKRHYIGNYRELALADEDLLVSEFASLAAELAAFPRVLCHRDYHVRNLMLRLDRLYIIDFQDARLGPTAYDLVSLLKDSIDLDESELNEYVEAFRSLSPIGMSDQDFGRQFDLLCIQRLLKALGTYAYQIVVRENFIYEQYIDGSLRRIRKTLSALSDFPAIHELIEEELNRL